MHVIIVDNPIGYYFCNELPIEYLGAGIHGYFWGIVYSVHVVYSKIINTDQNHIYFIHLN